MVYLWGHVAVKVIGRELAPVPKVLLNWDTRHHPRQSREKIPHSLAYSEKSMVQIQIKICTANPTMHTHILAYSEFEIMVAKFRRYLSPRPYNTQPSLVHFMLVSPAGLHSHIRMRLYRQIARLYRIKHSHKHSMRGIEACFALDIDDFERF